MAISQVEFEQTIQTISKMSREQEAALRQWLEDRSYQELGQLIAQIRADLPPDISEEEAFADVEEAIREVRAKKP